MEYSQTTSISAAHALALLINIDKGLSLIGSPILKKNHIMCDIQLNNLDVVSANDWLKNFLNEHGAGDLCVYEGEYHENKYSRLFKQRRIIRVS